jgi:hypothetical protein
MAKDLLLAFLGSLAVGFFIVAIVNFYRSSNDR